MVRFIALGESGGPNVKALERRDAAGEKIG